MERNAELIRQVADAIEAHPEQYDQCHYVPDCGTTACIAGWAAVIALHHGVLVGAGGDDAVMHAQPDRLLGLSYIESWGQDASAGKARVLGLFNVAWRPHDGLSVPDALRKIADGASIEDVSPPT